MTVDVNVKLMGVFRVYSGRDRLVLKLENPTVRQVVENVARFFPPESKHVLIDPELNDPRPNALVLVNGKEISVLKGLETKVKKDDTIVLIPVSHGG